MAETTDTQAMVRDAMSMIPYGSCVLADQLTLEDLADLPGSVDALIKIVLQLAREIDQLRGRAAAKETGRVGGRLPRIGQQRTIRCPQAAGAAASPASTKLRLVGDGSQAKAG
jgi:hypothetical protein